MNSDENHISLSREKAWRFIHNDHIKALRILEDKLNDLVKFKDVLSHEEALEILRSNLAPKKDKEQVEELLKYFIRYYDEKSNNVLAVNEDGSLYLRKRSSLVSREESWWFIDNDHVMAFRILEDKLNDLVYTNDVISHEKALEILRNNLAKKRTRNKRRKSLNISYVTMRSPIMFLLLIMLVVFHYG